MTLGPKVPTREQSRCDALGLESRLLEYELVLEYQLLKYKLSWYSRTSGLMYQLPSLYSRIVFTLGVTYISLKLPIYCNGMLDRLATLLG